MQEMAFKIQSLEHKLVKAKQELGEALNSAYELER